MVMNMTLNISELRNLAPESIWFEITPDLRERVERDIDRTKHSNQIAKYHARLNRLSLYALQSWIESQADKFRPIELFPNAEGLAWIWEITNGTAFNIGNTRLVIIPSDFTDTEELIIPQEWVDVPNWAGKYYLAVQIDEGKGRICLWGYISYDEVKKLGKLDDIYRNYHLDREDLHDDFEVLWIDCQINTVGQLSREVLPQVDNKTAEGLIAKIEIPNIFSPRLDLEFDDLKKILDSIKHLKKLHMDRNTAKVEKLSKRFEAQLQQAGIAVSELINATYVAFKDFPDKPVLPPGFMGWEPKTTLLPGFLGDGLPETEVKIEKVVNNLYAKQDLAKKVDRPRNIDSPKELLIYLMQHTTDQALRWEVASYLWEIEPDEDENNYSRRITKDVGLSVQGHQLCLMVAIIRLPKEKYAVLANVYVKDNLALPHHVQLTLFSKDNKQLKLIEYPAKDDRAELFFTAIVGTRFNICISVDNAIVTEAFEV
jgi:Protein of unknown function (DUF1822)